MSAQHQGVLSAARLALAIKRVREERPDADLVNAEPIAVVGIGCRLPGGVHSPEDFWRVLVDGIDTVTEVPRDRWSADDYYDADGHTAGKTNSRWGGFVDDADRFDPVLFGISPREAATIDPQQRLLLEVAWEAIEDSGRAPESLAGSRTGIFVGIALSDYERFAMEDGGAIHGNSCTGSYRSVASGRISFLLDARGPSVSLDTACSSSLVTVHMACQSLRTAESDFALAGGVNLHLLPEHYIGLAQMGMLARDGRCKTFDASADGFVPSEGCGLIALKRLTDALAEGDRIYAVIRGSALNQDGRSTSLTAPSGLAQQEVVAAALRNARVPAACISYVETHGTGTALGDPIEVEALAAALGEPQEGTPQCVLGAVKSNFGHLEAAAGITGLIKAALALHYEQIPANLHFKKLNPHISLEGTRLEVAAKPVPWKRGATPRFAGVSSFGFSGTNAHVVLEEAVRVPSRASVPSEGERLLLISARTPAALNDAARQYCEFLQGRGSELPLYDLCHAAAVQRSQYEERLAIAGASHAAMRESIEAFLAGRRGTGIAAGRASGRTESLVYVCSGQGSQWPGMGTALMRDEPVFRSAMEECAEWIRRWAGWSLIEELSAPDTASKLGRTEYAQPAIFAIQVALARLFASWGVQPGAVIGHSAGEIAAAHLAGALELGEAARIVVARGRVMEPGAGKGRMALVRLPVAGVLQEIMPQGSRVSVAAVNSSQWTVISGECDAVDGLVEGWKQRGIHAVPMPANYAFHSVQMESFAADLAKELGDVATAEARIPVISTVLGTEVQGSALDAGYWRRNVRATVQFSSAMQFACGRGMATYLELGPHPVLVGPIGEHLTANGQPATAIATLRRGHSEHRNALGALGQLHIAGYPVAWSALYPQATPPMPLPRYPYQKQRFWFHRKTGPQRTMNVDGAGTVFEAEWRVMERGGAAPAQGASWLVVGADAAKRESLAAALCRKSIAAKAADPAGLFKVDRNASGVIWLVDAASDQNPVDEAQRVLAAGMSLLGSVVRSSSPMPMRFWAVTQGAVATPAVLECEGLSQAPLWGMLRSVAMEHPETGCVRLDLDPAERDWEAVAEETAQWDGEEEIALHGGRRYVRRLASREGGFDSSASAIRGDRTYLITGGLGAIGLRCAEWLASKGARNVLVVGRHGPKSEAEKVIAELRELGVRVEVRSVDVADAGQVGALLEEIEGTMPALAGIFHAAGVLDDGIFLEQTADRVANVLAAKARGAWNLHHLTCGQPLDIFVLFSSIASLTGSPGQSGYAAANAFLDGLAHYRHARGLAALSVNWGAWAGGGMAVQVGEAGRRRVLPGLRPMTAERCFAALEQAIRMKRPQLAIADADWGQWSGGQRLMSELAGHEAATAAADAGGSEILRTLEEAAPARRRRILIDYMREAVTRLLGLETSGRYIDETQPLLRLGMDSLMALEFRNLLASALGRSLGATLVFDHPTLGDLADFLGGTFARRDEPQAADAALEELTALSDAEAEELLKAELNRT
ncbi:MAG TPA: type I polyketide synthase [Acidobacteriaceae bacterium]|jgi:acyl transferase domain-containing protein|nr:type I polyketide synthase [Acidobacteriaceae bacterium]